MYGFSLLCNWYVGHSNLLVTPDKVIIIGAYYYGIL